MQKSGLTRKVRLVSKSMKSQPGKQTSVIHILPSISRSKDKQTLKFKRIQTSEIFFLKNHTQNMVEKLYQTLF